MFKMGSNYRIPLLMRARIAYLSRKLQYNAVLVIRELKLRNYSYIPTVRSVRALIEKFRHTGSIEDKKRRGKREIITDNAKQFINQLIQEDEEITINIIKEKLQEKFQIMPGRETIRKTIKKLGWNKTHKRYCPMISTMNKVYRLFYRYMCIKEQENFDDCIFTGGSSIQHDKNGYVRFTKCNDPKPEHPNKVHVWAGISRRGGTKMCVFTGILDAEGLALILDKTLIPFLKEHFPDGHRFVQDTDPEYIGNTCEIRNYMINNKIHFWPTPAESPDMNPIELIWGDMKRYLATVKPMNQKELLEGIESFWLAMTPSKCSRFIDDLKTSIPLVVLNNGGASGH